MEIGNDRTGQFEETGAGGSRSKGSSRPGAWVTLSAVVLLLGLATWTAFILPDGEEQVATTVMPQLELLVLNRAQTENGTVVINGKVRNIWSITIEDLQVRIDQLDGHGRLLDSAKGSAKRDILPPGIVSEFQVEFDNPQSVERWEHSRVTFTSEGRVIKYRRN